MRRPGLDTEGLIDNHGNTVSRPGLNAPPPGTGGVRKLRWSTAGKGKRGGVRVVYYYKKSDYEIWMLTIYSKSKTENIPAHILKRIAEEIKNG